MARIKIKGNRDPLIIQDDKARKINALKSDFENKKMDDAWIELEGGKSFYLSKIEEIEIEPERKISAPAFVPPDEESRKAMLRTKEKLIEAGIIRKQI